MLPQEAARYWADVLNLPDPLAKLQSIWHSGAEENDADVIWEHNQNLLPHNASLRTNRGKLRRNGGLLYGFQQEVKSMRNTEVCFRPRHR